MFLLKQQSHHVGHLGHGETGFLCDHQFTQREETAVPPRGRRSAGCFVSPLLFLLLQGHTLPVCTQKVREGPGRPH